MCSSWMAQLVGTGVEQIDAMREIPTGKLTNESALKLSYKLNSTCNTLLLVGQMVD